MKKSFIILYGYMLFLTMPVIFFAQTIPFDSERWDINAGVYKLGNYFGKDGIFIKDGGALIKDSGFKNGIIEFDIAVTGERGFMGALFRVKDRQNGEEFYIRPHQSGNPDANQYTPIFNGNTAWQLYYGEGYAAPVKYSFNEWMHIKIVVLDQQAEVYIVDMENPALFIPELKRKAEKGRLGVNAGSGFAPAYFANFSYKEIDRPKLKSKPVEQKKIDDETVKSWQVSNAFDIKDLKEKYNLNMNDLENYNWTKLNSEGTGITNLARIQGVSDKKNTVLAKLVIDSNTEQVKKLKFGYSDNVLVYVNGKLTYGGTNFYTSRDYRYLGTIGLFDEVYLDLKKGENTILFAVSERFGGWGILARFDDLNNINIIY